MSIEISCASCNKSYRVKDELAGKTAKCGCGEKIPIPVPPAKIDLDETFADLPPAGNDIFSSVIPESGQMLAKMPVAAKLPVAAATSAPRESAAKVQDFLKGTISKIAQIIGGSLVAGFLVLRALRHQEMEGATRLMIGGGAVAIGLVAGVFLAFRDAMRKG